MNLSPERIRTNHAKAATLSLSAIDILLHQTARIIGGNEQDIASPHGTYVALHLGALFARLDMVTEESKATAGALPGNEAPSISVGSLTYMARTDMHIAYGKPELSGIYTSLNPDQLPGGIEAARHAQTAADIVERRLGEAFAATHNFTIINN